MLSDRQKHCFQIGPAGFISEAVKSFTRTSPANRLPGSKEPIFDEPLVGFAAGDDPLFDEYRRIIAPTHLTPHQALAQAYGIRPDDLLTEISAISWILPVSAETRRANRRQTAVPALVWSQTRWHGEDFNNALRGYLIRLLTGLGYRATAPAIQPFFQVSTDNQGPLSNWSERHIAYAAGLGTFSLSDGFITPRGIAHRCGSVITDLGLPPTPRTAADIHANCLYYADGSCQACVARCPVAAITPQRGHDKVKCRQYLYGDLEPLKEKYEVGVVGCGLCQTNVPCEAANPVKPKQPSADG